MMPVPETAPDAIEPAALGATMAAMRARLVDAGCDIFLRDGFALNLRDVAVHAGVSRQTVYRHFSNRETLVRAIISHLLPTRVPSVLRDGSITDPRQALLLFAEIYLRDALNPRAVALYRVLTGPGQDPEQGRFIYAEIHKAMLTEVAGFLHQRRGGEAGTRRAAERMAERFLGAVMGYSRFRKIFGEPEDETERRLVTREAVEAVIRELPA